MHSLPSFFVDPEPLCMVLESHFSCYGDGRGGGVLSNNLLASMSPGANKIWIVFDWCPNHAANGNACPWLLCVLVEHVSWWCRPLSNYLFGWEWGVVYVPSPPKYYALQPLFVHWCIMLQSRPRRQNTAAKMTQFWARFKQNDLQNWSIREILAKSYRIAPQNRAELVPKLLLRIPLYVDFSYWFLNVVWLWVFIASSTYLLGP